MTNSNSISLLVGLKNNLEYSRHFYKTTRELYPHVEICFVSYGSTDGTHEWLDSLTDPHVKYHYSEKQMTFSDTFNKAAEISTGDYVAYLHNDIVLAPGFLENLFKHIGLNNIVSYTTIEPPIFAGHERPGKIIHNLGIDLQTFDRSALYEFALQKQKEYYGETEPGITFFMCMPRQTLLDIGGMDNLYNPMFCEDDDLIKRFKLLGLRTFTSLDAICYHFVSKTSRFSAEYQHRTQEIEIKSNRNYIRKWGSRNSTCKYNIAFVIKHCNMQLLQALEPWCDRIYIEDDMQVLTDTYINQEQQNTKYDLKKRVLNLNYNYPEGENDIVVIFDARNFTNDSFNIIQNLSDIITESGEEGTFQIDCFEIVINNMTTYEKDLIICSTT